LGDLRNQHCLGSLKGGAGHAWTEISWEAAGVAPATASIPWSESVAPEVLVFVVIAPRLLDRIGATHARRDAAGELQRPIVPVDAVETPAGQVEGRPVGRQRRGLRDRDLSCPHAGARNQPVDRQGGGWRRRIGRLAEFETNLRQERQLEASPRRRRPASTRAGKLRQLSTLEYNVARTVARKSGGKPADRSPTVPATTIARLSQPVAAEGSARRRTAFDGRTSPSHLGQRRS
jgi:hypothetical protein